MWDQHVQGGNQQMWDNNEYVCYNANVLLTKDNINVSTHKLKCEKWECM